TPSVPNLSIWCRSPAPAGGRPLALAVLGRLAGLLQAVLLRLLLALVAREEARPLERRAHLGVDLDQRPGDAEPQRTGLARHAAAVQRGVDVVGLVGARDAQRLGEDHLVGLGGEVLGHVAVVDL